MVIISDTFVNVNRELSVVKQYYLNSGNMFLMSFTKWLDTELKKRGWRRAKLAKVAGFSEAAISLLFAGKRKPGIDMCLAIAEAFDLPDTLVLEKAGILSPEENVDHLTEEAMYLFNRLSEDEREEKLAEMRWQIERRRKRGNGRLSDNPQATES